MSQEIETAIAGKKSGLVDVWLSEISNCSKIPYTLE